ncbi:endoplasmic reticulum-resident kdel protein [Aspergillus ruber CBS 135680]|uniref:Endoplasmic reticulum-resident kdel protein n=1 Tax=Aspergillus ruber (strain CBS 135680) TaxID=1388766 RepID=A0A017SI90_ASPRC|nr:endoplasmic reticulum-resident kdel protein [Aspergillus ruber CBS 135680]EYE96653.1 endoplasmic reticulum-resident kdel protein [Aspergillus ruber CBS 135680]
MKRYRLFDSGHPTRHSWSLQRMLWTSTMCFWGIVMFTMWFGMNSDRDNVHPLITQMIPAGHCTCQTSTTFQCADCLNCLASSAPSPAENEHQHQQQSALSTWRFEYGRDDRNMGLERQQCHSAFPGLFQDVVRAKDYWRAQGGIAKEDLDAVSLEPGMARAIIQHGELYIVAARAKNEDHRRKILAALSSMHRALTASPERATDTIEFIFSVEDRVDDVYGGSQPIWVLARKASEQSAWLMPDFGFWSWEHWKQHIGPYSQAVDRVRDMESQLGFEDKEKKLVWRGKLSFAPKLRRALLDTARNETWSDVKALDWSNKENCMSLEDHCRYKFIAHAEGRSYSGSLKYRQACRSVVLAHKLQFIQHYHYLLVPSGPQQNYVEVERDFSDLPSRMNHLLQNPRAAERIADNNVRTFRERYLTPAAEACYWRALWDGYKQVSNATDSLSRMGRPAVERGLRFESFSLLSSNEMMNYYHVHQL